MPRQNYETVFVVGAGASAEFLLPTGRGLLSKIQGYSRSEHSQDGYSQIRIDEKIEGQIVELGQKIGGPRGDIGPTIQRLRHKALWLSQIAPVAPSIDNLLHTHQADTELVQLGKMFIAAALVESEQSSLLADVVDQKRGDKPFPFIRRIRGEERFVADTWLGELFRFLVELRGFDEFLSALSSMTFITFNYDRCIEHFLASAAQRYFQLNESDLKEVLAATNVIHPYGSLGSIVANGDQVTGFAPRRASFVDLAAKIKTFTEGKADPEIGSKIYSALSGANRVFFLGFGYLDLNLQLLFEDGPYSVGSVIGTHHGISKESAEIVARQLAEGLLIGGKMPELIPIILTEANDRVSLHDLYCADLLRKFQFFLRQ